MLELAIGMPATICIGSDCYPGTVIGITPSGKTVEVQEDDAISLANGSGEYNYHFNSNNRIITFRYSKKINKYRNGPYRVIFGSRRFYQDPHS